MSVVRKSRPTRTGMLMSLPEAERDRKRRFNCQRLQQSEDA